MTRLGEAQAGSTSLDMLSGNLPDVWPGHRSVRAVYQATPHPSPATGVFVPETELRGRRRECEALDRLVEGARAGRSGVVVLRGEAGIGKTALLDYLCDRVPGCRVVRAAGVESEMELPFAGLHQLCAQFLDRLPGLPGPQTDALRSAFGLRSENAPDRFLVGLAVLTLLSKVAEEQPLVCVVDDAQWLDTASEQVLAFVARRLAREPAVMVFAVREPCDTSELATLPVLAVRGLDRDDTRALLRWAQPGPMDERVRERLVTESHGNPLALLERARGRVVEELAGGFGLSKWRGVPSVEESFRRRVEALPGETRALLLVAAAEPLGDPLLLWRAAERLGIGLVAADPVETDGLLTVRERVTFSHPLVRSVVYRSAEAAERRATHLALAEVTGRDADPARHAWHLAAAAVGPDEKVAAELERSAGQARARGGQAAAASFLQRAVALTADPTRRTDRALAGAEASLQAGAFSAALELLVTAETEPLDDLRRSRVDLLRAQSQYSQSRGREAALLLLRAAESHEPLDPRIARGAYLDAWGAASVAGAMSRGTSLAEISRKALTAGCAEGPLRSADLLLEGLSLTVTGGRGVAVPLLRRAAAGFSGSAATIEETLRWGVQAGLAAFMVWDLDAAVAVMTRQVRAARESGSLTVLSVALSTLAQALCLGGDTRAAALLVSEAHAVTAVTGAQFDPSGGLMLAGLRGHEAEARRMIDATISNAMATGQGTVVRYARWATAMLCNGLGQYEQALAAAQEASDDAPEMAVTDWALIELVEAAARVGRLEVGYAALERLSRGTAATGTDWGLGTEARLRALLSDGTAADRLYDEAIERLSRTGVQPELARAHLIYGEWLRRGKRRLDARGHLRTAHEMFATMRMEGFAERARRELAASGERVQRRGVGTIDELTAQEAQIGQLAAAGHTNPEIGAQLFLSPRTVEWHLRKLFMKLGVTSRRELASALGETARSRTGLTAPLPGRELQSAS